MKVVLAIALLASGARAFRPSTPLRSALASGRFANTRKSTRLAVFSDGIVDPHWLYHVANGLADVDVIGMAAGAADATAAATDVVPKDDGWFGDFVNLIESAIRLCDRTLESATGQKSYGASIVLFTLFIKGLTYPLTYTQLRSTSKMQAIQPKVKEVQAKYASNPEVMQREMSALYAENDVNPLAGCLPSLVQIPIFIGLYRALLKLAKENLLDEPFLWLPNLEGPVYGSQTSDWLFQNWVDGAPSLGWHDTLCFLTLPVILIACQSVSQRLMAPPPNPNMDESQAASQEVLKFLPILFGFFALNVPSGLGVYWVTNTLVTTASNVAIKAQVASEMESSGMSVTPAPAPPRAAPPKSFADMVADAELVDSSAGGEFVAVSDESAALKQVEGFGAATDDEDGPFGGGKRKNAKKKKKKGGKK